MIGYLRYWLPEFRINHDQYTDEILLVNFPRLFRNRHETPMQRGFESDDGWFQVLYDLGQQFTGCIAHHLELDVELIRGKDRPGIFGATHAL